jgi:hypothetical protein
MVEDEPIQAEKELDAILHSVVRQQQEARRRSRLLAMIPIVIAVLLFSYIAQAAAHYQRRIVLLQRELQRAKEQPVTKEQPKAQNETPTLTDAQLQTILDDCEKLDESLRKASDLQVGLVRDNQGLAARLRTLEINLGVFSWIKDPSLSSKDQKSIDEFFDLVDSRRSTPPVLSPDAISDIALTLDGYRRGSLQNAKEANSYFNAHADIPQRIAAALEDSKKHEAAILANCKDLLGQRGVQPKLEFSIVR